MTNLTLAFPQRGPDKRKQWSGAHPSIEGQQLITDIIAHELCRFKKETPSSASERELIPPFLIKNDINITITRHWLHSYQFESLRYKAYSQADVQTKGWDYVVQQSKSGISKPGLTLTKNFRLIWSDNKVLAYKKNRKAIMPFNSTLDTDNSFMKVYRAMEFYLEWHEFLIAIKVPVFRLEDLMGSPDETYSTLVRLLQSIDMKPPNRTEISSVMGNDIGTNSRKHRDTLSWSELCYVHTGMTKRLLQMSQGWGYYKEKDATTIC